MLSSSAKVNFHYLLKKDIHLPRRKELKLFIKTIFKKEHTCPEKIDFIFCNDPFLLKINLEFLQHNYYTDIITFDLSDSNRVTAEIYISIDRVRENAKSFKTSIISEIHRVMFHGVLHLCGYDDTFPGQKAIMKKKEDYYLKLYQQCST